MAFRRWLPRSLQQQAAFIRNFTAVFTEIAASLGFTQADIDKLAKDEAVMQYLARTEVGLKAFKKSFQVLRDNLTGGQGVNEPEYMKFIEPPEPPIVPYGIFDRLFRLADRIEAAEHYTTAVGARLGILSKAAEALREETVKLRLKAKPLAEASVEVIFVRGKTSGVWLFMRRADSEQWIDLGRYFYSPAIVKIPLLESDKPEQIQLRGRHLMGNDAFGDYSDIIALIVAP